MQSRLFMWRHPGFLLLPSLFLLACGPEIAPLPPSQTYEEVLDGKLIESSPTLIVLVVDDVPDPSAADLRARLAESVRASLLHEIEQRWGSCGSPDPAAWHPGDLRVVVVRPSAPDAEALLTPVDVPSLAWITRSSTKEEVEAVVDGVTEAMSQRPAGLTELYRPLRAMKRTMDLVTGKRAPAGDSEAAFVSSLPLNLFVHMVIASSRDDEDIASLESLALDMPSTLLTRLLVVGPFSSSDGTCSAAPGPGDTRLQAWTWAQRRPVGETSGVEGRAVAWPCDTESTWDNLLIGGVADCGPRCASRPLPLLSDGTTECRFFVDQTDLDRCDPERGWRDPDGAPLMVERYKNSMRRCEVVQLRGEALAACRTSLDCPGCGSGWCATEVPELTSSLSYCSAQEQPWPIRFVGGALDAPGGFIYAACRPPAP